jgi:hypothetical protein
MFILDIFFLRALSFTVFAEGRPWIFSAEKALSIGFLHDGDVLAVQILPVIWPRLHANADACWAEIWEKHCSSFKNNEFMRIHLLILVMPFLAMITWALFRDAYQQLTIILLIGIFYLLPKKQQEKKTPGSNPKKTLA